MSNVQTHGSLAGLTVTWNPAPQLGLPTGAWYGLNVRTGPAETHAKVGLITAGSTVRYDILGRTRRRPAGTRSASATPSAGCMPATSGRTAPWTALG